MVPELYARPGDFDEALFLFAVFTLIVSLISWIYSRFR